MTRRPKDSPFNPALREAARKLLAEREAASRAEEARARGDEEARLRAAQKAREERGERELFLEAMAGVQPLEPRRSRVGSPAPRAAHGRPEDPDAESLATLAELVAGTGRLELSDTDEYIEGGAPGLDPRLLRRLRQGDYAVQGHLDLHGMFVDEAREKVEEFLTQSRRAGKRCVLVVHGRGLHSKDQIPVLKERLRGWLARGRLSRLVLAFCTARPQDGGAGAMYVLLRR